MGIRLWADRLFSEHPAASADVPGWVDSSCGTRLFLSEPRCDVLVDVLDQAHGLGMCGGQGQTADAAAAVGLAREENAVNQRLVLGGAVARRADMVTV
ncbi:hypothetical protein [Streptomyces sp. NPDC002602]|uniref:hypothetical protein n=1 Tax=Streptomyces sp. NPDC002602 TaxID=3364654 RepID=UPI00369D5813